MPQEKRDQLIELFRIEYIADVKCLISLRFKMSISYFDLKISLFLLKSRFVVEFPMTTVYFFCQLYTGDIKTKEFVIVYQNLNHIQLKRSICFYQFFKSVD